MSKDTGEESKASEYASSATSYLNELKDARTALKYFHQAMECGYQKEFCLEGIADCHMRLEEYGEAFNRYQQLVDTGHFSISMGTNLAFLLVRKGEFTRALSCLERARGMNTDQDISSQLQRYVDQTKKLMEENGLQADPDRIFDAYVKQSVPGLRRFVKPSLLPFGHERAEGCAVIVELREHPWLEHCLRNVAYFLPDMWSMLIIHGNNNREFIQQVLESWGMSDVIRLHNLGVGNVTRDEYSNLCKTPAFWDLIPTQRTLIFQTDSMLLRRGIEEFYEWDYIGAPWNDFHVPEGVGNGGLSLRTVPIMKEIASRYGNLSPASEMEDVFFARMLHLHGNDPGLTGRLATRKVAHEFCVEWRLRDMAVAESPLAIHQAWQSHPPEQSRKWFRLADSGYAQNST